MYGLSAERGVRHRDQLVDRAAEGRVDARAVDESRFDVEAHRRQVRRQLARHVGRVAVEQPAWRTAGGSSDRTRCRSLPTRLSAEQDRELRRERAAVHQRRQAVLVVPEARRRAAARLRAVVAERQLRGLAGLHHDAGLRVDRMALRIDGRGLHPVAAERGGFGHGVVACRSGCSRTARSRSCRSSSMPSAPSDRRAERHRPAGEADFTDIVDAVGVLVVELLDDDRAGRAVAGPCRAGRECRDHQCRKKRPAGRLSIPFHCVHPRVVVRGGPRRNTLNG